MHQYCHRCGDELPGGDGITPFCPHCGSPQLYLQEYQQQTSLSDGETTGALPPPHPRQIEWRPAIQCALAVAAVAAVLSLAASRVGMVSPLSWLWTISGSIIALGFYRRRRPNAWMDAAVGARIGLVTGLMLVLGLACSEAIAGLVARYGLHNMANFDAQLTTQLGQLREQLQRSGSNNPELSQMLRFIATPEFRVGFMLTGISVAGLFLLAISTVAGAVSGMLRTRGKAAL